MEDISIIDLELKKTTWSRVHSSMRTLHLKLSAEPDLDWIRFFREERESRIVIKRHGLWIEDGYIVFDCLLPDVESHHLPDFRLSIDYANGKYRQLKATRRKESHRRQGDARSEQEQLAMLRALIRNGEEAAMPVVGNGIATKAAPAAENAGLETKRDELRARFRAALRSRTRESDRGND